MNKHQHKHSKRLVALLPTVAECGMQSFDRLITIAQCAFDVEQLHGDICEFGCNSGRTAQWLRELLPEKHLWLYDTFAGHPADGEGYKQGSMSASRDYCATILDTTNTTIVAGNILDLSQASTDVPQTILLAHIDLDGYENTLHALNLVWPRLHPFGCVIIDDVLDPTYPGVKRALDEFIEFKPFVKYKIEPGCAGLPRVSVVLRMP